MPKTFAQSESGVVYIADGFNAVQRWDGNTSALETAGVAPPATAVVIAGSGSGSISGTYTAYQRFVDRFGNFSNLCPISNTLTVAGVLQIDYSSVDIPTSSQVVSRQILRNASGNTSSYYLDVDTTDLTSTTFTSTKTDATLTAQTLVPITDSEGNDLAATRYTVPPDDMPLLLMANGRMLMAGEALYSQGAIQITQSSATVQGIGTNWTSVMAGRYLTVENETRSPALISSVDTNTQTLTLSAVWPGRTYAFVGHGIRADVDRRRGVQWSEAGLPEAVPPLSLLNVARAGGVGDLTGMFRVGSLVYLTEASRTHTFSFVNNPALSDAGGDGQVFLSGYRGCVNQRCVVIVEDVAYMLDQQGVYAFRAGGSEPLSSNVQDLFDERGDYDYRIRWEHSVFFHGVHDVAQELIRFFVCLDHRWYPQHCLCFDYRQQRWWLEAYPFPICSSCSGQIEGRPVVFLGSSGGRVFVLGAGALDGVDSHDDGTLSGTVTSAGIQTLTDSAAVFDTMALPGYGVTITAGTGKGQTRIITSVTTTALTVMVPWTTALDTTSTYQIGGISFQWKSGVFRYAAAEKSNVRELDLMGLSGDDGKADLRLYIDRSATPFKWGVSAVNQGVRTTRNNADAVLDLSRADGNWQMRLDGLRQGNMDGPKFVEAEIAGVQGVDPVEFYELNLSGITQ